MKYVDIYFSDLKVVVQNHLISEFGDHIADDSEPMFSLSRAERKDLNVEAEEAMIHKSFNKTMIH